MRTPVFRGNCPALITPFHPDGTVDFSSFQELIRAQLDANVDAVCVCGTTGEASTLSWQELCDVVRFCVDYVDHRVPVIAGTGSNDTRLAVERTQLAQQLGADAALLVTPYYNKTTQAGLIKHYEYISAHTDIPLILYNVPGRTGISIAAETYFELSKDPKINGIKEASGNLALVTHTRRLCGEDFYIWSGNDEYVVAMMASGANGVISASSNLIPRSMTELAHLCLDGQFGQAVKIQEKYSQLIDRLFSEVNPIPLKAALSLKGLCSNTLRLPLCPMSEHKFAALRHTMEQLQLL